MYLSKERGRAPHPWFWDEVIAYHRSPTDFVRPDGGERGVQRDGRESSDVAAAYSVLCNQAGDDQAGIGTGSVFEGVRRC